MQKIDLSIVILNFNTKELLRDCLRSLNEVEGKTGFEIIVVDNGSSDGSIEMVKKIFTDVSIIKNNRNLGFAAGNNKAKSIVKGEYVLFLNSDTVVPEFTIKETLKFIKEHQDIGAVTCNIVLPGGELDKDTRRSFITPWIGLTHLYLHLDRLFPRSKLFGRYWYGYIPENVTHEVDVIQGAYFLTRKDILDRVDWFDEDYFLDGEDIDLSWKIKKAGWKIIYYPKVNDQKGHTFFSKTEIQDGRCRFHGNILQKEIVGSLSLTF